MSHSPWFRSPLTDLTGCIMNHQWYGRCGEMELKMIDCVEAHGLDRAREKCDTLLKDFQECASRNKQNQRTFDMRWERNRQYYAGERTKEEMYAPGPKPTSF